MTNDDRELRKELAALKQDHAVLKQEIQTMHADYKVELERTGRKFDATIADLKTDMAKEAARRDTEAAKRDKDNLRWQIGLWVAAVVVIGVLVRWPGS